MANYLSSVKAANIKSHTALKMIWERMPKEHNIAVMGNFQQLSHSDWAHVCPYHNKEKKFLYIINNYALEWFAMVLTRKEISLDLLMHGSWDLVYKVRKVKPLENSHHINSPYR